MKFWSFEKFNKQNKKVENKIKKGIYFLKMNWNELYFFH